MRNSWWAKLLRFIAILLMGLTAAFTLLGGAGTSCVALNPTGFGDKFAPIASVQWLYILFVLVTLVIGVMGVRATVLLVKGSTGAHRSALAALLAGLLVGGIHMLVSRLLRGSSMPVDMVVYTTLLTLVVFLLYRLPPIREALSFEKPSGDNPENRGVAAIALGTSGVLALTIQFLMAPTHTLANINYADAWHMGLTLVGLGLILGGLLIGFHIKFSQVDSNRAPVELIK